MTEHWIDRLSDYVDGGLAASERAPLEAHVARCEECAGALADLRAIVAAAGTLEDAPPGRDLWPGIVERIAAAAPSVVPLEARRRAEGRRFSFTVPQLAAAAVALLLIGASGVLLLRDGVPGGGVPTVAERPAGAGDARPSTVRFAEYPGEAGYAAAVAELEHVLEENRDRLDAETVRTVEANLAIIDRAIEDTRQALAEDPNDPYLNRHLASTMQRKVDVLRQATAATTRVAI